MVPAATAARWLGGRELLIILAVAVVLFGAQATHQAVRRVARAIWQLKKARSQVTDGIEGIASNKTTKN